MTPTMRKEQLVRLPPSSPSKTETIGGRRIRVLLDSGHAINQPTKPIQPKDLPMEDLRAAKEEVEAEEDAAGQRSSSSSNSGRKSASSGHMNGHTTDKNVILDDKNDEITESPVEETPREPERPVRDIRFGDLPHPRNDIRFGDLPQPRKHDRENSDGKPPHLSGVLTFSDAGQ